MGYFILITEDFICIILFNLQLHEVNHDYSHSTDFKMET